MENRSQSRKKRKGPWRWATRKTTKRSFKFCDTDEQQRDPLKAHNSVSSKPVNKPFKLNNHEDSTRNMITNLKEKNLSSKEIPSFIHPQQKSQENTSAQKFPVSSSKIPVYNLRHKFPSLKSKISSEEVPNQKEVEKQIMSCESFGLSPIERVGPVPVGAKSRTCSTPVTANVDFKRKKLSTSNVARKLNETYISKPQTIISSPLLRTQNISPSKTRPPFPRAAKRSHDTNIEGKRDKLSRLDSTKILSQNLTVSKAAKDGSSFHEQLGSARSRNIKPSKITLKSNKPTKRLSFKSNDDSLSQFTKNALTLSRTMHVSPKKTLFLHNNDSEQVENRNKTPKNTSSQCHRISGNDNSFLKKKSNVTNKTEFLINKKHCDKFITESLTSKSKQMTLHFYFAPDEGGKEIAFINPRIKRNAAVRNNSRGNASGPGESNLREQKIAFWRGIGIKRQITDMTDLDIILFSIKDVFEQIRTSSETWRNHPLVQNYSTLLEEFLLKRIQLVGRCQVLKKKVNKILLDVRKTSNGLGALLDKKFELQEEIIKLEKNFEQEKNETLSWKNLQEFIS